MECLGASKSFVELVVFADVYRDLSKPMGAQDPDRASEYKKRYDNWLEPDPEHPTPKFHYASHYSSAAATSFYLIRLEPFTGVYPYRKSAKSLMHSLHAVNGCNFWSDEALT